MYFNPIKNNKTRKGAFFFLSKRQILLYGFTILKRNSFICECLLSNYFVPGNVLDCGGKAVKKTDSNPCPCGASILVSETDEKQVT